MFILGDRWWPQTAKQDGDLSCFCVMYGGNVGSTWMLEVSLFGVGTMLQLERDARPMVKRQRQATNRFAPLFPRGALTKSEYCS